MSYFTTILSAIIFFSGLLNLGEQQEETYKFTEDIAQTTERDTMPWRYQTAAVNYSFIGNYQAILRAWDTAIGARIYTPTSTDSALVRTTVAHDARQYILARARNESIIIINEAHHNPRHRMFTASLLKDLYQSGYRYIGLEALADTLINERNFATNESGYYIQEPEFGNLLYEARALGFTVFGYEANADYNGKEREIEQAKNIQQFMKNHPNGKYIIHCGYDHVFEHEVPRWEKAMASRIKEYTNIDPFTIDQVKFSERSKPELGHYIVYALGKEDPFILQYANAEIFNGIQQPAQTDIVVIHPSSQYDSNGRPLWKSFGKKEYWLSKANSKQYSYPLQVLVYRQNEYRQNGIPADILEIASPNDIKPLLLQPNSYTVIVRNRRYEVIDSINIRIDKQ